VITKLGDEIKRNKNLKGGKKAQPVRKPEENKKALTRSLPLVKA
jgi:hypothetical protein